MAPNTQKKNSDISLQLKHSMIFIYPTSLTDMAIRLTISLKILINTKKYQI